MYKEDGCSSCGRWALVTCRDDALPKTQIDCDRNDALALDVGWLIPSRKLQPGVGSRWCPEAPSPHYTWSQWRLAFEARLIRQGARARCKCDNHDAQ